MLKRLVFAFGLLAPLTAMAADGVEALRSYYQDVHALRGSFTQRTTDNTGEVLEESSGHMLIQRPDRFRWNYETPYEQIVVADGEQLWVYDVDLEQVTARPLDQVLGVGPALLLSGDFESLESAFDISPEGEGWLRLTPVSGDWDFQAVRLKLANGAPSAVIVDSGFGQQTELQLNDLELNVDIPAAEFRFIPPEGVDVIHAGSME